MFIFACSASTFNFFSASVSTCGATAAGVVAVVAAGFASGTESICSSTAGASATTGSGSAYGTYSSSSTSA